MWHPDQVSEIASRALKAHADSLAAEQAVKGLDALIETEFHPLLAAGFASAGFGVFREHPYPGDATLRPKHAQRERCDLVLTQTPGLPIIDPVARLKALDAAAGTLFDSSAAKLLAAEAGIEPGDALWLEVKVVGQFTYTRGVPGPNRAYSSELLHLARSDIPKLSKDASLRHIGILTILFTEDERTARHDFSAFITKCSQLDLPIREPAIEGFDISDRIGNRRCTLLFLPIRPTGA